jgi:succinate dehydrogenase / fumarate reductase, flavoprotein subunit
VFYVRELRDRLILARVIVRGAKMRDESRGAHYKPAYPERNDPDWLKTTIAQFDGQRNPVFSFEAVDTSLLALRKRSYTSA